IFETIVPSSSQSTLSEPNTPPPSQLHYEPQQQIPQQQNNTQIQLIQPTYLNPTSFGGNLQEVASKSLKKSETRGGGKSFLCTVCNASFSRKYDLQR
ncbi:hypothetical protein HK099_001886, partial [Clydaea vesicula]